MERLRQLGSGWFTPALLLATVACAHDPVMPMPSRPAADVIDLRLGYPQAFDRVVRLLEQQGYEVEADEETGLIRTKPKTRDAGGVSYDVAVVVRMGGTDRESWLTMDQVALPMFREEERQLKEAIQGLDR